MLDGFAPYIGGIAALLASLVLRMEETMRPTTAFDDNVFDINALLHPGTAFDHPKEVLAHPTLSISEKRAILAS